MKRRKTKVLSKESTLALAMSDLQDWQKYLGQLEAQLPERGTPIDDKLLDALAVVRRHYNAAVRAVALAREDIRNEERKGQHGV